MKNLLTLLLLVIGSAAFANTEKNTDPKPAPATETHEVTTCKKTVVKTVKSQDNTVAKPAVAATHKNSSNGTTKACTTAEKSSFGITGYFVDFVHRSNVKLVNLLID